MRRESMTITFDYEVFDVGEHVRPTSRRCVLPDGIYTVVRCLPPTERCPTETILFVEGRTTGVSADYLAAADDPMFICHGCDQPLPIGDVGTDRCSRCNPEERS